MGLILVAGVVFGDDGENATTDGPPTAASSSEPTPDATTDEPTEEATPTEGAIPEEVEPVTYKGSGNKVLKINKPEEGVVLMTTTIKGEDTNQVIYSLDDALEENSLLVNTIGSYKGTTLLDDDGSETKRLKVEVEGSWVIVLDPITSARELNDSAKGSKDDVLLYRSGDAAILNFTSTGGDSNVAYWSTDDGTGLVVNDIGKFKAEAPLTAP